MAVCQSPAGAAGWANFVLRILQVCASAIVLGIFAYFLATLGDHDLRIEPWHIAVTAISGAALAYSICAASLALVLGGKRVFAAVGMILDFIFGAAFVAVAIMDRGGTQACSGRVDTPLGIGNADTNAPGFGDEGFGVGDGKNFTYMVDLKSACRLQKATLAVSIIAIFLFFISVATQHLHAKRAQNAPPRDVSANSYVVDPLKPHRLWWPFGRRRYTSSSLPAHTTVDADATSLGSIPLTDQQPATDKPPRYTRIFGRGKRDSVVKAPELHAPATKVVSQGSSHYSENNNDLGGAYYTTTSPWHTWSGSTWNDYTYGSSGVGDHGYSYGYGHTSGYDDHH
ncbi:hypothetical protein VTO42DRAFT_1730 [Malbranchea cinnamomea]